MYFDLQYYELGSKFVNLLNIIFVFLEKRV